MTATATTRLPYIVDKLFPAREVHLITGPAGSGKTRLMFQSILDWLKGKPIFGYSSHPQPFFYVSCDRSDAAVERVMESLQIPPDTFPKLSLITDPDFHSIIQQRTPTWKDIMEVVVKRQPSTKVVMLDGFGVLAGEGKYHNLYRFLSGVTHDCDRNDITVLGTTHTTKVKADAKITNIRQRVLGSVGWGGFCDGLIYIDQRNEEDPLDATRRAFILPRNEAGSSLDYMFDADGRLVPIEDDTSSFFMETELSKLPPGPHATEVFVLIGQRFSLARRTVEKWLKDAVESKGLLVKTGHGLYKRVMQ